MDIILLHTHTHTHIPTNTQLSLPAGLVVCPVVQYAAQRPSVLQGPGLDFSPQCLRKQWLVLVGDVGSQVD